MVVSRFIPATTPNRGRQVAVEKHLLEKHYSFLTVRIQGERLECSGWCQPSEHSPVYHYKLIYTPGRPPKVFVVSPRIAYDENIHMYSDGSLCLYYPKDFSWTSSSNLYNTFIPWTHEWFIFYELYLLTGEWKHPFNDHKTI
jgi:hypothetical protein